MGRREAKKRLPKAVFWGYIGVFLIALSVARFCRPRARLLAATDALGDVSVGAKIEVLEARLAKAEEKIASLSSPTASVTPSVTTAKGRTATIWRN
jgi:hypothetical protein